MGYILHARTRDGELPRMVWFEGIGAGDLVRMTVANAIGILAVGVGNVDVLESMGSGADRCLCSGDIWIELTDEPHVWNVSVINASHLGDIRLSSFEFACAIQRVQLERLNYLGAPELSFSGADERIDEEVRSRQKAATTRSAILDS